MALISLASAYTDIYIPQYLESKNLNLMNKRCSINLSTGYIMFTFSLHCRLLMWFAPLPRQWLVWEGSELHEMSATEASSHRKTNYIFHMYKQRSSSSSSLPINMSQVRSNTSSTCFFQYPNMEMLVKK